MDKIDFEKLDFEKLDFSDPNTPKGILSQLLTTMHVERLQAVATAIAVAEFQKGSPLTSQEKNAILDSVESTFRESLSKNFIMTYGEDIQKHF